MRKPIGITVPYREVGYKEDAMKSPSDGNIKNLNNRNKILEEVAIEFDKMKVFGDTAASFAAFVRNMKE